MKHTYLYFTLRDNYPRRITKTLGRPKTSDEETKQIRNTGSLTCYGKNKEERLNAAKEHFEQHREEVVKRPAERRANQNMKYNLRLFGCVLIYFVLKI